jgi:phage tail sheath gpL-like
MTISFNSISTTLRTPGQYIEFDNSRAVQGAPARPKVALLISYRHAGLTNPTRAAGTVAKNIPTAIPSAAAAQTYFGHGSVLAIMCERYKAANPYTELWAIAEDIAATTANIATMTITGPSTEAGTIHLYIGGEYIPVGVTNGLSAINTAIAVTTAVKAYAAAYQLPVTTADNGAGVVSFTFAHMGTIGLDLDIRVNYGTGQALPAGIGVTFSLNATPGVGVTAITACLAAMGSSQYDTIAFCTCGSATSATPTALVEAELLTRWGPMDQREGQSFYGITGNQAAMTALGNARNSPFSTAVGAGLSPTPTWTWAAVAAAVDDSETDPARPRQTLVLTGCQPPAKPYIFTQTERNTLLYDGVMTYTVTSDNLCLVERMITTYQLNAAGVADPSYLDIETMRTLAYLRYSLRNRIALRFPRCKLAADGTNFSPGQAIVTPAIIKSEILALFGLWENAGLVEDFEQFKTEIIVERNVNDVCRVDVRLGPNLLNQFRVFAGQIQYLL